ncbi:hypothetical protein ACRALDRAFT_1054956 [Sodiomyces alcalophilus JCM 7366]|uniref:uncharacterized protein n=1 Tax=Sodiomyces alcalophilus JCM 7366 TaxID=591952 RepID=UPI0039B39612
MDLPKGIVEDDKRIYREVANLTHLPPEVIKTFWRVYTITNRQLYDPTARRLENFWWHVWGSDRRHLKAEVIAALWQHISYGPSFVPLKGSPNRYEPPVDASSNRHELDERLDRLLPHIPEPPSKPPKQPTLRELSASSSRPPPPHPILKKPRLNSKSGPRPTARFVSPPESEGEETETIASGKQEKKEEDEGDGEDEEKHEAEGENDWEDKPTVKRNSSGRAEASGAEGAMRSSSTATATPNLPDRSIKKKTGPTKKFVVSTSAVKRRPQPSRRQSSHSSAGSSDHTTKGGSSAGSRFSGSQQESLTSNPEIASARTTPDSYATNGTPPLSAKALGKRPDVRPRVTSPLLRGQTVNRPQKQELLPPPLDVRPRRVDIQLPTPSSDPPRESPRQVNGSDDQAKASNEHGITERTPQHMEAPKMERASSHTEHSQTRKTSFGRTSSYGLLSNATAATSNVAAVGQVAKLTDEPDARFQEALGAMDGEDTQGPPHMTRNPSTTSLLRPTMPSPTPSVPMARSRSHLALLLAREKERLGDKGRRPGLN